MNARKTPVLATLLLALLTTSGASALQDEPAPTPPEHSPALAAFHQACYDFWLRRSPVLETYRGIRRSQHLWDDISDRHERESRDAAKTQLALQDRRYQPETLSAADKLDVRLFEWAMQRRIDAYPWHAHDYEMNHLFGPHTWLPSFLTNVHTIGTVADAEAWIARANGVWPLTRELLKVLRDRQERGILPPRATFARMLEACGNVLTGTPFDRSGTDSVLLASFRASVEALPDVSREERDRLLGEVDAALTNSVRVAFLKIRGWLLGAREAADNHGVWSLPYGAEYYAWCLRHHTTTDLDAGQIHLLGQTHVSRLHAAMREVQTTVGFEGTLNDFFEHMRNSEQFRKPNTNEGRAAYLQRVNQVIDEMDGRLDELFATRPQAELAVRRVEPFREASAGKAFYDVAPPDGSRPGVYYVNLRDMTQMPTDQLRALAYHEAIPGHHMQLSIAQEMTDLPEFRRHLQCTAYVEGWGLYAEGLGVELGLYADPYEDFGRLSMELWRAARLVVDTGLHDKRWTRAKAISWLRRNTPNPEADCSEAVDRYLVAPGQATAYMIGKLEIQRLRQDAETRLGDSFDVRAFHDVVLRHGAVPLDVLAELVEAWIEDELAS